MLFASLEGSGFRSHRIVRSMLFVCVLIVFALSSCMVGSAQNVNAVLRGTVSDSSGAVIAGADVELVEPATGQVIRHATALGSGDFEFPEIKPGTYELRCTAPGFKMFVANNIVLDAGETRRVDASLSLGEAVQQVTVSAGAAVINSETETISDLYTAKQHDQSPQVTPYPTSYALLTTLAGVQGGNGTYPVADGEQQSQQTLTFDGISNDLAGEQSNNATFFQQVSATMFNAPAESQVPVEINQITKRGANALHGKATYRIYDDVLNARGYFDTGKTPFLQHEWDLQAAGPIWKDHTFFYAGWFAQRIPLGTAYRASVPTDQWRNGVFSTTIIDPSTGRPFPNNTIPTSRMSSVALAIQNNYFPVSNINTGAPVDNYAFHFPFNSDLYRGDWPVVRVDHNVTKDNSLFVRWLMRQTPYVLNNGLPSLIWTRLRRNQQWAGGDTQILSANLVNNFRFGYSTDYMVDGQTEAGQTPPDGSKVLATVGLQGANPSGLTGQGFPAISIAGLSSFSLPSGGVKANNHILTLNDSVVWQAGKHAWTFGAGVQHFTTFQGVVPNYGAFTFDGSVTGNPYADFLLGLPESSKRSNPLGPRTQALTEYGVFAEDSYKVSHRLSVNYGLRWDLYGTPSASDHLMYNFDPTTGNTVVDPAAISKVSPLYTASIAPYKVVAGQVQAVSDKTNFAPRVGFAYELNNRSVLRGGYGLYTARYDSGGQFNNFLPINPQLGSTGPFAISEVYQRSVVPLSFPDSFPSDTASASVPSQSVSGYPHQLRHGHIQQFSATYEYQLGQIGLRTSYLGSRSTGLNYTVNTNVPPPSTTPFTASRRPFPAYVATNMLRFDGAAKYDSVQFEARRRVASLTFDASYTYARSLQNDLDTENPYDVLSHWANDGVTRRNYAVGSVVWALPFGKGRRYLTTEGGVLDRIASGWSTSIITYLGSGQYFSPSFDGADPSNTGTFGGLPDLVGDPNNVPGGKNINNWFNTAAFAVPQPGHFGNALPNSLEAQNLYVTDLSVTKDVQLAGRVHFIFITQISNLFNHPQFLVPSGDISVPGGNQYTAQFGEFDSLEGGQQRQVTFLGGFTF